jgi:hypothetical protein
MSAFWKHYEAAKPHIADAVDDVRHKLVEEAWFGRQVTGDIAEPAVPEEKPEQDISSGPVHPMKSDAIYEEVWGKAPTHADIYGHLPNPGGVPAIEPPAPAQENGPEPEL